MIRTLAPEHLEKRRVLGRWTLGAALLLVLGSILVGCGSPTPTAQTDLMQSPLVADSPLPTPTATKAPSATLVPTFTPQPTPTPLPTPAPGQIVVLHTNDNWGETEPCG